MAHFEFCPDNDGYGNCEGDTRHACDCICHFLDYCGDLYADYGGTIGDGCTDPEGGYPADPGHSAPYMDGCGDCNYESGWNNADVGCGCGILICPIDCENGGECNSYDGACGNCCTPNLECSEENCGSSMWDGCVYLDCSSQGFECEGEEYGCTNPSATNYNSDATNDDGSCVYPDYIEPSINNLWKFIYDTTGVSNSTILSKMQNFVYYSCTPNNCSNPPIFVGDASNIYYGELIKIGTDEISSNTDDILFAFIGDSFRGASFVKNIKGVSYIYLEVKFIQESEAGMNIDFYCYIDGSYHPVSILSIPPNYDLTYPSEITSTFGLL